MESRINRSSIQCWFETQPQGCLKPHCVFLHKKPRNLTLDDSEKTNTKEGLILPVMSGQPNNSTETNDNKDGTTNGGNNFVKPGANSAKKGDDCSQMKLFDDSDYINQSLSTFNEVSSNIEPINISLNDFDEESDDFDENERQDSQQSITRTRSDQNCFGDNMGGDFGVKTLEQIRMEKVFNSTLDDDSLIDDNNQSFDAFKIESQMKAQNNHQQKNNQTNKDLRIKIRRQKFNNSSDAMTTASNPIRNASDSSSDSAADIGVKTLDQIRKERNDAAKAEMEQKGLKENKEPKGQKRPLSEAQPPVIKLRRSGPTSVSSLKVQQKQVSPNEDCVDGKETISDHNVTTSDCSSNQSNVVSSTDTSRKRIASIDTDLDDFELFDGEPPNMDSNDAIDDDDDELMREINQVINS